jgi:hypothetical protein
MPTSSKWSLLSDFPTKILYWFLSLTRATCWAHLMFQISYPFSCA